VSEADELHEHTPERGPRWRGKLIVGLVVVVAAAIGLRVARGGEPEAAEAKSGQAPSGMTTGLVDSNGQKTTTPPAEEKKDSVDVLLPFVTEGGVAMILGLLLGMATRAIFKIFFFLALLAFITLQYLAYKGILDVNWAAMKDFVLHIVPDADWSTVLQHKIASFGAFGLGYLLGLKRG